MTPRKSPKNRRVYQKHGLYALKGAIKGASGQGVIGSNRWAM